MNSKGAAEMTAAIAVNVPKSSDGPIREVPMRILSRSEIYALLSSQLKLSDSDITAFFKGKNEGLFEPSERLKIASEIFVLLSYIADGYDGSDRVIKDFSVQNELGEVVFSRIGGVCRIHPHIFGNMKNRESVPIPMSRLKIFSSCHDFDLEACKSELKQAEKAP